MGKKRNILIGIILMLGILVLGILFFVHMHGDKPESKTTADISQREYDENQIVIINRTENYAYGCQDNGIFIDGKGRVYCFDFSQLIYPEIMGTDAEFMKKLKDIQKYAEPLMTIEESVISEAINLSFDIAVTETYETECAAFDAGSKKLYVCKGDTLVACRENGDYNGKLKSAQARKFMAYFDDVVMTEITAFCEQLPVEKYTAGKVYYYTENALYFKNIHSGYVENVEHTGRYVVTNEEELTALEQLLGSNFGIRKWQNEKAVDCIFFIKVVNVSSGGYDLKNNGICCQDGAFEMIPSEDSKEPKERDVVTEALDGFVFVAAFPKDVAELYVETENGRYFDFYGNEWERLE